MLDDRDGAQVCVRLGNGEGQGRQEGRGRHIQDCLSFIHVVKKFIYALYIHMEAVYNNSSKSIEKSTYPRAVSTITIHSSSFFFELVFPHQKPQTIIINR